MDNSEAKIKIKVGAIEVDYEGDPAFLVNGLNVLIKNMAEIHKAIPASMSIAQTVETANASEPLAPENGSSSVNLATASIAARMGAKSGPELVICAIAHLELVKGLKNYDRKTILEEMRTANAYYKDSFSRNLSVNLTSLVKAKKVNEIGSGKYCLNAGEKKKVEAALADHG